MHARKVGIAVGLALVAACLAAHATAQDAPATLPAVIRVSDKAALAAANDMEVVVEGTCTTAVWSNSGRVMNIAFADTAETNLTAVVFARDRMTLDAAFGGDVAKALAGAKVRLKGNLRAYGGRIEARKGQPEITISDPSQLTIVEPASTQPAASQPATRPAD